MARADTPRLAHFVFGMKPQDEPFHLVHYLAIASCLEVVRPAEVFLHCAELPYGAYWDLIRPRVTVHRVAPVPTVEDFAYPPAVAPYRYAHHADFVRLDALAEWGGLYADIDTLFVAPLPDECWEAPAVIGSEADVIDERTGRLRASASNALVLSRRHGRFVQEWRERIADEFDGSWAAHSCFLAHDLAVSIPAHVRIEPRVRFHRFAPTPAGVADLLERDVGDLGDVCSMHLMAHLWWSDARREFSRVHARTIDERWIADAPVTYANAARRFLPGLT
jgi:Glycosyltransferase sugar-binding region containing DXD motif